MVQHTAFADALDAVENLEPDAQMELIAVLNRRLAERGRQRIAATVEQARLEFAAGQSNPWPPLKSCARPSRETPAFTVPGLWARLEEMAEVAF